MKLAQKAASFIFALLLLIAGVAVWYFYGDRLPFLPFNYVQRSSDIDTAITAELVSWGIDDTNVINEYRKEIKQKGQTWIVVNREIKIDHGILPADYVKRLKFAVSRADGTVFHSTINGNRYVLEAGYRRKTLNRLFMTIVRPSEKAKYYVALVIDDVGYNKNMIKPFFKLGIPLTFAVLPQETFSRAIAEEIHNNGHEVILHLPMEPIDPSHNPGKGALLCSMNEKQIKETYKSDVDTVPFAIGVSNHMGSKFVEDKRLVKLMLLRVRESGFFFLDSKTTQHSAVSAIAQQLNVPCMTNNVFLDNEDTGDAIERQIELLAQDAQKHRAAIGIGHVSRKETAAAIKKAIPALKKQGIEFISLSDLFSLKS